MPKSALAAEVLRAKTATAEGDLAVYENLRAAQAAAVASTAW